HHPSRRDPDAREGRRTHPLHGPHENDARLLQKLRARTLSLGAGRRHGQENGHARDRTKQSPLPPHNPLPSPRTAVPVLSVARVHRSEEHTSELQSRVDIVCRLLLEKKNTYITNKKA